MQLSCCVSYLPPRGPATPLWHIDRAGCWSVVRAAGTARHRPGACAGHARERADFPGPAARSTAVGRPCPCRASGAPYACPMPLFDTGKQRAALAILLLAFGLVVAIAPYATGLLGAPVLYVLFSPL